MASCNVESSTRSDKLVWFCMQPVVLLTSRTQLNPGRCFLQCPFYNDTSKDCKFFRQLDQRFVPNAFNEVNMASAAVQHGDCPDLKTDFEELLLCVTQFKEIQIREARRWKQADQK